MKSFLISLAWLILLGLAIICYIRGKFDGIVLLTATMSMILAFVSYHHNKEINKLG